MTAEYSDLTTGRIDKKLILFFLPILTGSFFQQLYTMSDAIIIGRFIGKTGLASIDSIYSLLKFPVNFLIGLSVGASIMISQLYGAKRFSELSEAMHTAILFGFVSGTVFSVLGVFIAPYCLLWMAIPKELYAMTLSYVRIYCSGIVFSMIYNIGAGILRALGDSKTPFRILLISGISNIVLDLILIGIFSYGVKGAAIATIISQALSATLVLFVLKNERRNFRLFFSNIRFHPFAVKMIFQLGLPIGVQSVFYPIANMMIQASINRMGTDYIAAWALCGKLDFLIWLSADSLAAAIATFVAQNYGAQKEDRILKGVRIGLGMTLGMVIFISIILFIWCESLGKLFIDCGDYGIIPKMCNLMRFVAPFYFIYVFGEILSSAVRGLGESFKPMLLSLIGTCVSRIVWILSVVPRYPKIKVILGSYPLSWMLTACFFIVYYQSLKFKKFEKFHSKR